MNAQESWAEIAMEDCAAGVRCSKATTMAILLRESELNEEETKGVSGLFFSFCMRGI